MATVEIPFLLGLAVKSQSTRGTATSMPVIGSGSGGSGAINNTADGAVLGDPGGGAGKTGISLALGKSITEKAAQTGSFSTDFGNFVARTVDSFSFVLPLKGNGATAGSPPVASNFTPDAGIVALWRAAGFAGAASGSVWRYTPTASLLITAAIYNGNTSAGNGLRAILRDVEATGVTFDFAPGEVATATFDLVGIVDSVDESGTWGASPFAYGNQASLSAPPVRGVGFGWGPAASPDVRALGFSKLSIECSLDAEEVKASNLATGSVKRQAGRTIKASGIIDAATAEVLYELNQLAESNIANAKQLQFTIGTPATSGAICNAIQFTMPTPELTKLEKVDPLGNSEAWSVELIARTTSANGEFRFDYL